MSRLAIPVAFAEALEASRRRVAVNGWKFRRSPHSYAERDLAKLDHFEINASREGAFRSQTAGSQSGASLEPRALKSCPLFGGARRDIGAGTIVNSWGHSLLSTSRAFFPPIAERFQVRGHSRRSRLHAPGVTPVARPKAVVNCGCAEKPTPARPRPATICFPHEASSLALSAARSTTGRERPA